MRGWGMAGAVLCVAIAGCGGGSEPKKPRLRLTLVARPSQDTQVLSGIRLVGRTVGGDAKVLDLESDPYPFDRFKRVATVPTDAKGAFQTGDLPGINTRYRVVQALGGHAVSPVVTVYVHPRPKANYLAESPRSSYFRMTMNTGRARARAARVYLYTGKEKARVWKRVGTARARVTGAHRVAIDTSVPVDPSNPGGLFACSPTGFGAGLGRDRTPLGRCGARTLRAHGWKLLRDTL